MEELDQLEALRKLGTVTYQNLDLANVGEHARLDDVARPSKVGELAGNAASKSPLVMPRSGKRSSSASVITACASIAARVTCCARITDTML